MSPPPPLEEIVRLSDHIFLGTVERIDVVDSNNTVVSQPSSPLNREMRIRLTVRPNTEWLRTPLKRLPTVIEVTYDFGKFILSYESEKNRYLGKRWLFLVSGSDFHPAAFMSFAISEDRLQEVINAVQKQPVE